MDDNSIQKRGIRSFVLRTGRMTPGQQTAYDTHWQRFGLSPEDGQLNAEVVFGRSAPLVIEIGFGMGQSLVEMAKHAPEQNFLGIEVHKPGVGKLLHGVDLEGLDNVRVYCHDAVEVLRDCVSDASVDRFQIYFPDPWHKKRHHKRRLIQPPLVAMLVQKLVPNGTLHLATDWENYAQQMMDVLSDNPHLRNTCGEGQYAPRPAYRPITKFEQRGQRLGHGVWDLVFSKA